MIVCAGCSRSFDPHPDRPDAESWPDYCALCQVRIAHAREAEDAQRMVEAGKILAQLDDDGNPYRDSFIGDHPDRKLVRLMWDVVAHRVNANEWPPWKRRG